MHAALRTTELRAIIFKQLPPTTLVALATTCTALSAAALEILWYELKDFKPLAMLLPNSKRGPEVDPGYILPKDVERIRYYGPFVRRLTVPALPSHLSPSTLEQIMVALGDDDLFPSLRRLEYNGPSVYAPCLHRLIPHTLLSLAVTMVDSHDSTARLERREITALAMLRTRDSIRIREFSLKLSRKSTPWPVADILAKWDSLQALSLTGQIEEDVVDAAISLPHLETLALSCLSWAFLPRPSLQLERRHRLPLRNLRLQGIGLFNVKLCLDTFPTMTRLDMSELHVRAYYGVSRLSDLCRAVQSRCIMYALENIVLEPELDALLSPTYQSHDPVIALKDFQPLLAFEWLCHCNISVPSTLDIDDNDLQAIAQAWPQVSTLCLRGHLASTTRCTLEGLVHFARYCKRLERLTIALRGSIIPTPRKKFGLVHRNLHHLDVLSSPIIAGQEPRIASFLGTIFPSISRISSTAGPASYVHAWGQVMATYRSFVDFAPLALQLDPRDGRMEHGLGNDEGPLREVE
ncbi:hypothetical protein K523DRAFT_421821 [Schizophyllum commune Tattone D]|nr:hypothetical protein K523DRAFT_421821 [Schizophyllum commune Tattone D]